MTRLQKAPTLRQYLDSVNSLKRIKSQNSINNPQSVHHTIEKTIEIMEQEAGSLLDEMRKKVEQKNKGYIQYYLLQHIHQLANILKSIFQKVKQLQSKTESTKNIKTIQQSSSKIQKLKKKKSLQQQQKCCAQSYNELGLKCKELMAPQIMSKEIKFSTDDLSNIGASTRTNALLQNTVRLTKVQSIEQKLNEVRHFNKNPTQNTLKAAKSLESKKFENEAKDMISSSGSYKIRVSVCQ